jgi:hypothetical protein
MSEVLGQLDELEALLLKAMQNGYMDGMDSYSFVDGKVHFGSGDRVAVLSVQDILFNHRFARALFKDSKIPTELEGITPILGLYQGDRRIKFLGEPAMFHLQNAVVSEFPIDYMYKAVFGKDT